MLNFVLGLQYYMTGEVIEPNWHIFMEKMKKVSSVDDVLTFHSDFIDQCQRECMLTVLELLQPLRDLLDCIMDFCKFILVRYNFIWSEITHIVHTFTLHSFKPLTAICNLLTLLSARTELLCGGGVGTLRVFRRGIWKNGTTHSYTSFCFLFSCFLSISAVFINILCFDLSRVMILF